MWSDNETSQDLLGFRVHADLVRSIVTDPDLLPVTIGIFGDWGSGKTSIMKMLQEDLCPEHYPEASEERKKHERIVCLYFNGWLFEGYDDAKSAILSSILIQLAEHKLFGEKVKEKVVSLIKSVNWMRLVRLGVTDVALPAVLAYLTGGASLIPALAGSAKRLLGIEKSGEEAAGEEAAKSTEGGNLNWEELIKSDSAPSGPLDVRTFRERFGEMLQASDIKSLVVLIDDLDRCSPERIIDNLEAIKLFLNVDRTAFVIGADPRIVRHAIQTKYKPEEFKGEDESEGLVTDYLEKLIQIPYHLPRLSPAEVETYMALLFCMRDLNDPERIKCQVAYEKHRIQDRYSVFGYGNIKAAIGEGNLSSDLAQSLTFCAATAPLVTDAYFGENDHPFRAESDHLFSRREPGDWNNEKWSI